MSNILSLLRLKYNVCNCRIPIVSNVIGLVEFGLIAADSSNSSDLTLKPI